MDSHRDRREKMPDIVIVTIVIIAIISAIKAMGARMANKILRQWMKDNGIAPSKDELREYIEKKINEFFKKKG